jgi:hypothetical protein
VDLLNSQTWFVYPIAGIIVFNVWQIKFWEKVLGRLFAVHCSCHLHLFQIISIPA